MSAPDGAAGRVFVLSPASCGGARARLILRDGARLDLACRLRAPEGAALGEAMSFLSGLYFRGKLAYARRFAQPPPGVPGVLVITPADGLRPPETRVDLDVLRRYAGVAIDAGNPRYRRPLVRDARELSRALQLSGCEVVLLGSIATGKYSEVLAPVLGERLVFPADFRGRGDMSRGGLLLRCVVEGRQLGYVSLAGAQRRGPRPPRLVPRPGILSRAAAGVLPVPVEAPAEITVSGCGGSC
jgi:hypothetical protein